MAERLPATEARHLLDVPARRSCSTTARRWCRMITVELYPPPTWMSTRNSTRKAIRENPQHGGWRSPYRASLRWVIVLGIAGLLVEGVVSGSPVDKPADA